MLVIEDTVTWLPNINGKQRTAKVAWSWYEAG